MTTPQRRFPPWGNGPLLVLGDDEVAQLQLLALRRGEVLLDCDLVQPDLALVDLDTIRRTGDEPLESQLALAVGGNDASRCECGLRTEHLLLHRLLQRWSRLYQQLQPDPRLCRLAFRIDQAQLRRTAGPQLDRDRLTVELAGHHLDHGAPL